mgnify:CR=1 FL=1
MADAEIEDLVLVERDGSAILVTNNNAARRNALSPEFYQGFVDALKAAENDPEVSAVIVRGAGEFFCAGGDLNALKKRREMSLEERKTTIGRLHNLIRTIRNCSKPVIAAVEGGAAGAGVSIALACDFVVAARNANFTVAYIKVGLTPDGGATAFLSEALPRQLVTEMCLFGDPVGVERLAQAGAVNRVVEPGATLAEARRIAERLAVGPERAIASIKQLVDGAKTTGLDQQLDLERQSMAEALGGAEAAEGISAFLGKTKPEYAALRKRKD